MTNAMMKRRDAPKRITSFTHVLIGLMCTHLGLSGKP